jgi:signal transduction histidine kinase/CheY-like chemotaxis protein
MALVSRDRAKDPSPDHALAEQVDRMRRQQAALGELARRQRRLGADADAALREICELAADTLGVARASVWRLGADRQELRCLALYELPERKHSAGLVLRAPDYPRYFAALESGRAIDAHDAREDPRTSEFRSGYLEPLGINAMLDAAIRDEGRVVGVVCHEHVGPARAWTSDELAFAGAMADQAALVLAAAERHGLEQERERMRAQLLQAQKLESLGTLAAGVAHEINNPLAYLSTNLDFIADALADPSRAAKDELLDAIRDAQLGIERVRLIVRDLRTFSRGSGREKKQLDVRATLDDAVKMSWNEIRHRAILVKDYRDVPPVLADELGLGQVFLNLLLNAAQAIDEGHADRHEIRVSTRTAGAHVEIEVRDNGKGIAPELLPRIFDPFFTTKPIGQGTGLGLSICLSMVQAEGGTIAVTSSPGQGSTFTVRLPAQTGAAPTPAPPPLLAAGRRARVLLVDDEEALVTAVCRYFRHEHEMVGETKASAALERLKAGERFDVILCDLMMPEMTGMELWDEAMRIDPAICERMVFLTGGAFTPRAREFIERVAAARVDKPFRMHELRALLLGRLDAK